MGKREKGVQVVGERVLHRRKNRFVGEKKRVTKTGNRKSDLGRNQTTPYGLKGLSRAGVVRTTPMLHSNILVKKGKTGREKIPARKEWPMSTLDSIQTQTSRKEVSGNENGQRRRKEERGALRQPVDVSKVDDNRKGKK